MFTYWLLLWKYLDRYLDVFTSIDLCLNDLLLFSAFWSLFSIWDFNSFLYWKSRANSSLIAESTANLRASSCFLHCRNCSVRRLEWLKYISFSSYEQPIRIPNFCNEFWVYLLFEYFYKVTVFLSFIIYWHFLVFTL